MLGSIIGWIALRTGLSTLMIQLLLCGVGGLGIYFVVQWYHNRVWDEAVIETKIELSKREAEVVEKRVEEERKKLSLQQAELADKADALARETSALQRTRELTKKELGSALEKIANERRMNDAQINTAVSNIPGDKLDDAIRQFIAKYRTTIPAPTQ
jgi:hypothetical protein